MVKAKKGSATKAKAKPKEKLPVSASASAKKTKKPASRKKIPIVIRSGAKTSTSASNIGNASSASSTQKRKSNTPKEEEVKGLPDGWPVSSHPPPLPSLSSMYANHHTDAKTDIDADGNANANYLKPGSILHKCSGRDIKLTKNSDSKPNFAIQRGRFLFVLPGLLSLKKPSVAGNANGNGDHGSTANGNSESQKDAVDPAIEKEKTTTTKLFSMGKVRNLHTDEPTLEIPLPADPNDANANTSTGAKPDAVTEGNRVLILKGTKIKTTSKFLVLNCKTSGAINCRNVFQEMVVFRDHSVTGAPSASTSTSTSKPVTNPGNSEVGMEEKSQTESKTEAETVTAATSKVGTESETNPNPTFHHYGGSERALDGGRFIRGVKNSKRSNGRSCTKSDLGHGHAPAPSLSQESADTTSATSTSTTTAAPVKSATKSRKTPVIPKNGASAVVDDSGGSEGYSGSVGDDSDSDCEEAFQTTTSMPPREKSARRNASKRVSYTYKDDDGDDDDADDASGDDASDKQESKEEEGTSSQSTTKQKSKKVVKPTPKPKRGRRSSTSVINIDLTDESDDTAKTAKVKNSKSVKSKKTAAKKKSPVESKKTPSRTRARARPSRSASKKDDNAVEPLSAGSDALDNSSVGTGTADQEQDENPPKAKQSIEPKSGRRSSRNTSKMIDLTENETPNKKKEPISVKRKSTGTSQLRSPLRSPVSSFRKRRKGASPAASGKKKSPFSPASQMSIKLDDDDEFIFIE